MHLRYGLPLLTALCSLALVSGAGASGPTASASTSCGNVVKYGAYQIKATRVSCKTAKRTVVPQWNKKCGRKPTKSCTLASGYRCKGVFDGYEGITVKCTKGTRKVVWKTT